MITKRLAEIDKNVVQTTQSLVKIAENLISLTKMLVQLKFQLNFGNDGKWQDREPDVRMLTCSASGLVEILPTPRGARPQPLPPIGASNKVPG